MSFASSGLSALEGHCPAMAYAVACQLCGEMDHTARDCSHYMICQWVLVGHYHYGYAKGQRWWPKGKCKSKYDPPCAGGGERGKGRTKGKGMGGKGMRGNGEAVESTAVADARLPWVLRPSDDIRGIAGDKQDKANDKDGRSNKIVEELMKKT